MKTRRHGPTHLGSRMLALASAMTLVGMIGACGDTIDAGGISVDAGIVDDPLTSLEGTAEAGSLDALFQDVIAPRCSGQPGLCHNGQFEPNLSTVGNVYLYMVNRPAIENRGRLRVAPGDPDRSFLVDKLRGRNVGTQMPLGADPLSEEDIQLFEDWIRDGALRKPGADPAPSLDNPPIVPEIAMFDAEDQRLDLGGPFRVSVGTTLVLRHSVADFETPDAEIPFAAFLFITATGDTVVVNPEDPEIPELAVTTFDPDGPKGFGDDLNYQFTLTVPETFAVINDQTGEISEVDAVGQSLTVIAIYSDNFPVGVTALAVSPATITVE